MVYQQVEAVLALDGFALASGSGTKNHYELWLEQESNPSILSYPILSYTILYYTILYYTILYHTIPYHTILCYSILY